MSGEKKSLTVASSASALEEELVKYEQLADAASRAKLDSQKGLQKASELAEEATASQARLGVRMQALSSALAEARDRNQTATDTLRARQDEIGKRGAELSDLLQRFAALGTAATEITRSMQAAGGVMSGESTEGGGEAEAASMRMAISTAEEKTGALIDEARKLEEAAKAAEFSELARQAETLRQQIHSVRNKLTLLGQRLAGTPVVGKA